MIRFHRFDTPTQQAAALAAAVAGELGNIARRIAPHPVLLAVSGGTSPHRFFAALSEQPLCWSQIDMTLADERWVPETDADSNAALVKSTLLKNAAAASRFHPLADTRLMPQQQLDKLQRELGEHVPDIAVLGMGEDGHTASLFSDAPEWADARITASPFVLIHPQQAKHARISWSLRALQQIPRLFLLINGPRKLAVWEHAMAAPIDTAISQLAHCHGGSLDVYWCAE